MANRPCIHCGKALEEGCECEFKNQETLTLNWSSANKALALPSEK